MSANPLRTPASATNRTAPRAFTLADIATKSKTLPNRYGFYAEVGFGKTSFAAYTPAPVFLMTRGETGLEKLIESSQVPETAHLPEMQTWEDLLAAIKMLRNEDHAYKTLVLDTANGAERLMHEFVCERDFGGDWGERGFMGYMRGYDVALSEWRQFLNALDDLRQQRGMSIFFLLHSRIKTFKNPAGADYDRYAPEMHDKTWALTRGWLDCILFGNFEVAVRGQNGKVADPTRKGKVSDVASRILYTNSDNPTFEAKNRLGLPAEIEMGSTASEAWTQFTAALKGARKEK